MLEALLAVIWELTEQIHQLESAIERAALDREETQLLMTIPSVSYFSSVLILGEIGDIDRTDDLVSYAGLAIDSPGRRKSVRRLDIG